MFCEFWPFGTYDPDIRTLSKLYDVPVGFVPPCLRLCIALFAVAEGWMLLDIG